MVALKDYQKLYPTLTGAMVMATYCPACKAQPTWRCQVLSPLDDCPGVPLPITGGFHAMRMTKAARDRQLRPYVVGPAMPEPVYYTDLVYQPEDCPDERQEFLAE